MQHNIHDLCTTVISIVNPTYTLYADGVNDDAPAIQAIIDGQEYKVKNRHLIDYTGSLIDGRYQKFYISKTLVLRPRVTGHYTFCNFHFITNNTHSAFTIGG